MDKIHEVNWGNFKAKFNKKEQESFEELCYLLFCSEFGQDKGIFRYKNQAGCETDPIENEGEVIAWQAKYLEVSIATKKDDLIRSIDTTKERNPTVTKILFYLNKEFKESSKKGKKDPAYKTEIEDHGRFVGITVEWRVPSHFEAQLALDKNRAVAQHYFSLERSIVDFITELNRHTEGILESIRSEIPFGKEVIRIDRTEVLRGLYTAFEKTSVIIVSGKAGTGKTAVIKDMYAEIKGSSPFFVFKASEFNIANINKLFRNFGDFTFSDFLLEHRGFHKKYVIIDSAEKLSDVEIREVFQEFLLLLLKDGWKIIFTARHNYLEDLKWQLVEIFGRSFEVINIENIPHEELSHIAENHNFELPQNERFLDLILTPFYLNEYLQHYDTTEEIKTYSDFQNLLWNKRILNSSYRKNNIHLEREKCFLEIARIRSESGSFYVSADHCDSGALTSLESDEIIKHDADCGGYFITHDIYEEWALDKVIDREFRKTTNFKDFFLAIGGSLSIRRAFRVWLSERLLTNQDEVKTLVEHSIVHEEIEVFWKDEILISVLLSDYSGIFFEIFETKLVEDKQEMLLRIIFLLRTACKEIDEGLLRLLGLKELGKNALKTVFTLPKGNGWCHAIDFIHKHNKEIVNLGNMHVVIPLLDDWNTKHKDGDTTQKASQIGLYYYEEIAVRGGIGYHHDEKESQLIKVILNGSLEIKKELSQIFEEVLSSKDTSHREKYYPLVKTILTSITDGLEAVKNLPEYVIRLADKFWFKIPDRNNPYSREEIENYFCLNDKYDFDYFPPSALQTPVFQLLRFAPYETVDFIISFVNKTVECYWKSGPQYEVEEIELRVDGKDIKQYISNRLWNAYRGTQASTSLLESIHMALEKWLLAQAKITDQNVLENFLKYILRNSKSASITAVVASIVMAYPEKLFNIASILFRTKELFHYDTTRIVLDQGHKSQLLGLKDFGFKNFMKELYENERIEACDEVHRNRSLEFIALQYQLVKAENDQDFEERRETIWQLWDSYYDELPPEPEQSEEDKTWRLYLARMDSRKMSFKTEPSGEEDKVLITLDPEIDPKLREYSEDARKKSSEHMKHVPLRLWANYRFEYNKSEYGKYQQYEDNPNLALTEAREIMAQLRTEGNPDFQLFNRSTPSYACAVLMRDFADRLTEDEKKFCRDVIIDFASFPIREKYSFQISDGIQPAIISLPLLLRYFPQEKEEIKSILFLLLLNRWPQIATYAIIAVLSHLWESSFEDAQSIFLGYLSLSEAYDRLAEKVRKENYAKKIYEIAEPEILRRFTEEYEKEFKSILTNAITYEDIGQLEKLDLRTLNTAFELLPLKTDNAIHKKFLNAIFPIFAKKVLVENRRDDKVDPHLQTRFLDKLAKFLLTSSKEDLEPYLKPFLENFADSRDMADFFSVIVSAEDKLYHYDQFWTIWNSFYEPVTKACKKGYFGFYLKEIIYNYLLAWPYWREDAREWHSLKEREKTFFEKVSKDMGHCPPVLYSLSKLLNDIGSNFLKDGIFWISDMLDRNKNLWSDKLEINTIYYIENIVRKYVMTSRQKIRTTNMIKKKILVILNLLVERGSVTGYLLREDIL